MRTLHIKVWQLALVILGVVVVTAIIVSSLAQTKMAAEVLGPQGAVSSDHSAAELIPDSTKRGDYRCKAGYTPIQVPLGKTVQADGATYTLNQKLEYSRQVLVNVTIELGDGVAAPTMIINTAGHVRRPATNPQHLLQIALGPGATGTYPLTTSTYDEYYNEITDITLCTVKR